MLFLRKFPYKFKIPKHVFATTTTVTHFFSTAHQNPRANPKPFPDVPTAAYYDDCINDAAKLQDLETVHHLLNKRVKDGCFNTASTFKFLTNTEASLSLLPLLSQALARLDAGFTRKSAYDSLIARLCKLKRVNESLQLIEAMALQDTGLNACSFHPILSVLTRCRKTEEAWRVMELMRSVGVSPDLTAFNFFLTRHCYDGDLTAAAMVLERIEEENLGADSRTYDALVLGACRAGKVEGAMVLLRSMQDDGLPALYSTYAHVIGALLDVNCCEQAIEFVKICGGKDLKLDTESFGILANRLIRMHRHDEAMVVLEEMKMRGLKLGQKLKDFYAFNVRT